MKRFLIGMVLFVGMAGAAMAEVRQEVRDYVDAVLPDLNAFVRVATGYKATHLPTVHFIEPRDMAVRYYGADAGEETIADQADCSDERCVWGLANGSNIFLRTDFVPGKHDWILLHEVVHFQQFEADKIPDDCPVMVEEEAYKVSDAYTDLTGNGIKSDPFTVMLMRMACQKFPY